MKANESKVGNKFLHDVLGRVLVDSAVKSSRTKVNVTCIDRGKGWNDRKQRYKGIKEHGGWSRGQNYQHGHKDSVHIETLTELPNQKND